MQRRSIRGRNAAGSVFIRLFFIVGVLKGFVVRSALILGLGVVRCGLVGKDERCMGEFTLVTMLSLFFSMF